MGAVLGAGLRRLGTGPGEPEVGHLAVVLPVGLLAILFGSGIVVGALRRSRAALTFSIAIVGGAVAGCALTPDGSGTYHEGRGEMSVAVPSDRFQWTGPATCSWVDNGPFDGIRARFERADAPFELVVSASLNAATGGMLLRYNEYPWETDPNAWLYGSEEVPIASLQAEKDWSSGRAVGRNVRVGVPQFGAEIIEATWSCGSAR